MLLQVPIHLTKTEDASHVFLRHRHLHSYWFLHCKLALEGIKNRQAYHRQRLLTFQVEFSPGCRLHVLFCPRREAGGNAEGDEG